MEYCGVSDDTLSFNEYLDRYGEACGSIGVPYSTFWHGSEHELEYAIKSYFIKLYREQRIIEETAWLHGAYVNLAIGEAFDEKSGRIYPDKPIEWYGKGITVDEYEEREQAKLKEKEQKEEQMLHAFMSKFTETSE